MSKIQWTKPVCQLDGSGLFVGIQTAELDIYTRDGSYIIPGGCIDAPAPQIPEGHAARWNGEAWEFLPDFRGRAVYHTETGAQVYVEAPGELPE